MPSANISYLNMILITNILKVWVYTGMWDFHVHTSAHSCTQISWARGQIPMLLSLLETQLLVYLVHSKTQASEYGFDVATHLHADYAKLILLVHPD